MSAGERVLWPADAQFAERKARLRELAPQQPLRLERTISEPIRFPFYTDTELAALPPKIALVFGMLFSDTLAAIIAKWESFKTFFALELAFCMAVGADFHGRRVKQGAVVYLCAEGGAGIVKRLAALRAKYGGFTGTIPLIIHPGSVLISEPDQVIAMLSSVSQKMDELDDPGMPIVAVFIDTVARNMNGDENKVEDMNAFVRGMDTIRNRLGACVVAVHHTGWEGERSRGSTALPSAIDTEIFLARDDDRLTVKCTKQKDDARFADFELEARPLAGSIVLEPVVPGSSKLTPNEVRALKEVQHAPGLRSTDWYEATGLAKGSFANARKRLLTLSYVNQKGGVYLATDAGRLAFGTRDNGSTDDVQGGRS